MNFSSLTPELVTAFEAIVSPAHVLTAQRTEAAHYETYGRDHTEDFHFAPDVVLRPGTTDEEFERAREWLARLRHGA